MAKIVCLARVRVVRIVNLLQKVKKNNIISYFLLFQQGTVCRAKKIEAFCDKEDVCSGESVDCIDTFLDKGKKLNFI